MTEQTKQTKIKAYRVTSKWDDDAAIVGALTPGKARYANMMSAHDAGIYAAKIIDFKAKRAPEYDAWVEKQMRPLMPISEYYVKERIKNTP